MKGIKAIILIGGEGKRFGNLVPKQFHSLSGKKVYLHTIEKFLQTNFFEKIIIVCHSHWIEEIKRETYSNPSLLVVPGGNSRQESSYLGLLACGKETDYVVIHDGVRPFVTQEILRCNIEAVQKHGAVDTCIASADTLVCSQSGKSIDHIPQRSHYLRGQTPQSFRYSLILDAHQNAKSLGITQSSDDCSLVMAMGKKISIVSGDEHNIKITTELDLFIAEQLFRLQQKPIIRVDHAYSLEGKKIAITGGTGGIGQAILTLLQKEKTIPIIISKSAEKFAADLSSATETKSIFHKIFQEHGPLDGLINSVGLFQVKAFDLLSIKEIQLQFKTNLLSYIYCCKFAKLKEQGHIINIASSSYSRGRKDYPIYSSAKAAIVNFTQALSEEYPERFINVLVPQRTLTSMRQKNFPQDPPETLIDPKQVAQAVIDLLKQKITGSIVEVRKI